MSKRSRRFEKIANSKLEASFLRATRVDALNKQGNSCFYCFELLTARTATADHVTARAKHGNNRAANIVAACHPCNRLKGAMPVEVFVGKIAAPKSGDHINFWHAWSRRRINIRLASYRRTLASLTGSTSLQG